MKIKDIFHEMLYDCDRLTITLDRQDRRQIIAKLEALGDINKDAEYDIKIQKVQRKRTAKANAYMWKLADMIARKISNAADPKSATDVYRDAVRRVGVFEDVTVKNAAVKRLINDWQGRGIGWIAESLSTFGDSETVRLYYGSSTYTQQEMGRLLDDIIYEAKNLNIETETPDEIARMKEMWGEAV